MSVTTLEAVVENGQIQLPAALRLPERIKVYVVIPNLEAQPQLAMANPSLAGAEQPADFVPPAVEEDPDVLTRAVVAMSHRTPEEIAAAQARASREFPPAQALPLGQSVVYRNQENDLPN